MQTIFTHNQYYIGDLHTCKYKKFKSSGMSSIYNHLTTGVVIVRDFKHAIRVIGDLKKYETQHCTYF